MDLMRERLRARGHHRACGGGESSSSSDQITNMTDRRVSGRDGAQVSGDSNTVTVLSTDHDAVLRGSEATRSAIAFADNSVKSTAALTLGLFSAASEQSKGALSTLESVYEKALSSTADAYETAKAGDQRVVSMVALAVVGLVAAGLLFGKAR